MYNHHGSNETPGRKKARIEVEDYIKKRTDALTRKIQDLTKEFPELKYILDQSDLKKIIEPAVVKYRHQGNGINSQSYMLPDEILEKCFSYVEGSYLLVAPVSTKFCKVYKDMLKDNEKKLYKTAKEVDAIAVHHTTEFYYTYSSAPLTKKDLKKKYKTTYEVAVTSVSTAKYCLEISQEKDVRKKLFSAAALKGKLDVLKLAKHVDILHFWERTRVRQHTDETIHPIVKIAQAGHLHILQSLRDDFNMGLFLDDACEGATLGGQIHILRWFKSIGCLHEFGNRGPNLCDIALRSGQVEALKWLQNEGFEFVERLEGLIMLCAIQSKNIDMLSYCIGEGFIFSDVFINDTEAIKTENVNIVKFCFENGCEFSSAALSRAAENNLLDVCKYLQSKSVQWEPDAMEHVIRSKSLAMLKFAHENGCEWSQDTWACCMRQKEGINWDMMNYLHENNCPWRILTSYGETRNNLIQNPISEPRKVIEFILSKKLPWGGQLLLESINYGLATATRILVENTPRETLPKSLSYIVGVSHTSLDLGIMQYLHSQGIPFGEDFLKKYIEKKDSEEDSEEEKEEDLVIISKWALKNSYQPSAEEIHIVSCKTMFNVDILRLLYEHSDLLLENVVKKCFREHIYTKGFGSEQFQFFLDLGCPLTKSLTKTIFQYWLSNPGNDILKDIVAILLVSQYPQLSRDDINTYDEDSDNDGINHENDYDGLYN